MKNFLLKTLKFLGFSLVFFVALTCLLNDYAFEIKNNDEFYPIIKYGHLKTRLTDVNTYKNTDILVIGSSHAFRSFDTRIFDSAGIKLFHLGSSSQTPIQTHLMLTSYIDKLNPKLVIYETYPIPFTMDGVESSLDVIANRKNDLRSLLMAFRINHKMTYNCIIYGMYRELFNRNKNIIEQKNQGTDTYIAGGFVEKDLHYYKQGTIKDSITLYPRDEQLKFFKKNLSLLQQKNIPYIFTETPVTSEYRNSVRNYTVVKDMIKDLADYWDFNSMKLTDTLYFYDTDHLNQIGVRKFNQEFIDRLKNSRYYSTIKQ